MASIRESQASLGSDFNVGGIDKVADIKLTQVEVIMTKAAFEFIQLAKKRLTQRGKIDTGSLSDIVLSDLTETKGTYEITIGYLKSNPASKYFDFNDLGVKALKI
jgi:ABC-type phosphate transport system auxiliary subunit